MVQELIRRFRALIGMQVNNKEVLPHTEQPDGATHRAATPYHVAIIMDGNGRWATRRHLPRAAGHRAGVEALRRVVEAAPLEHVSMLTVYAFSTENWNRPQDEVNGLMELFWDSFRRYLERLDREGVRIRHFGRMDGLPADVQQGIRNAVEKTKNNTHLCLNVCLNYGGRAEISDAIQAIVAEGIPADHITEEVISQHLYSHDVPDPDLIIRTAGEMRLSNFLVWQSAYSEYYSTATLFPDFDRATFAQALDAYSSRKRRFGKLDPEAEKTSYALNNQPPVQDANHMHASMLNHG